MTNKETRFPGLGAVVSLDAVYGRELQPQGLAHKLDFFWKIVLHQWEREVSHLHYY